MSDAPVQVLVLSVADVSAGEQVLQALGVLAGALPVRLLDAFVVEGRDDGLHVADDVATRPAVRVLLGDPDGPADGPAPSDDPADAWDLGQVVVAGSTAVVAVLEHRWAEDLRAPIEAAGATLLDEVWLDADDRATLRG